MIKINPNLPVCLSDGTPARIICTDRPNADGWNLVVMYGSCSMISTAKLDGRMDGHIRELMNQFVYDGLQNGMELNPGNSEAPDDYDSSRPPTLASGVVADGYHLGRWTLTNSKDDIVLYWPKPKTYTLELTREEAEVLSAVCTRIGGDPKGRRRHMENIAAKLPRLGNAYADWFQNEARALYFK